MPDDTSTTQTPPAAPVQTPPNTPDIVQGNQAEIRKAQERIAKLEKQNQDTSDELKKLQELIAKAATIPAPVPASPNHQPMSIATWLENLCFKPKV